MKNLPDNTEIIILEKAFEDLGGWKKAYGTTREKLQVPENLNIFGPNVHKGIFSTLQNSPYWRPTIYIVSKNSEDEKFIFSLKAAHLSHNVPMFTCLIDTWEIKKEV